MYEFKYKGTQFDPDNDTHRVIIERSAEEWIGQTKKKQKTTRSNKKKKRSDEQLEREKVKKK